MYAHTQEARENMDYYMSFTEKVTGREIRMPQFVQCRAEDLPFKDESFDIVTCTYCESPWGSPSCVLILLLTESDGSLGSMLF